MKRPWLEKMNLNAALGQLTQGGVCTITMSIGQWDGTLQAAYDVGFILLELDDNERPVRAYRKPIVERTNSATRQGATA